MCAEVYGLLYQIQFKCELVLECEVELLLISVYFYDLFYD